MMHSVPLPSQIAASRRSRPHRPGLCLVLLTILLWPVSGLRSPSAVAAPPFPLAAAGETSPAGERLTRFRGGMTQINKLFESHVGGTWGLDGILPTDDVHGMHWAGRVNKFSGGTQYQGSLGVWRRSDAPNSDLDGFGASLIADLFHDTRAAGLWLGQLRGQAGIATSDTSAVGVLFTTPLNQKAGLLPAWPHTAVSSAGAYVSQEIFNCQVQTAVGYRNRPDSLYVDLAIRRALVGDTLFAYASTNYVAEGDWFGSWIGFEYRLGRRRNGCGSEGSRREVWDDPVIFNSFNYGENSFWHNTDNPPGAAASSGGGGGGGGGGGSA